MSDEAIKQKKQRPLTPKQMRFVAEYLKDSNAVQACIRAGYSPRNAQKHSSQMIRHNEAIKNAIASVRETALKEAKFEMKAAMNQTDEDRALAYKTNNAAAAVKATELKSKLAGILTEKVDVRQVGFQVVIKGVDDGSDKNS